MLTKNILKVSFTALLLIFSLSETNGVLSKANRRSKRNDELLKDDNELEQIRNDNENLRSYVKQLRIDLAKLHDINNEFVTTNEELLYSIYEMRSNCNALRNDSYEQHNKNGDKELYNEIYALRNLTMTLRNENNILHNDTIQLRSDNTILHENIDKFLKQVEDGILKTYQTIESSNSAKPKSCAEAMNDPAKSDGVYEIYLPKSGLDPFNVYCMRDPNNNGSAWTIVLRRQDGSIDFYRRWRQYEHGFGSLNGEYFIGLKKLYALTSTAPQELWIKLGDFENKTRHAKYEGFAIGDGTQKYNLTDLGKYYGDAGDSLRDHKNLKFSTWNAYNNADDDDNYAIKYLGAGWYRGVVYNNLFGPYKKEYEEKLTSDHMDEGIIWYYWHGDFHSLKYAHMALRPLNLLQ